MAAEEPERAKTKFSLTAERKIKSYLTQRHNGSKAQRLVLRIITFIAEDAAIAAISEDLEAGFENDAVDAVVTNENRFVLSSLWRQWRRHSDAIRVLFSAIVGRFAFQLRKHWQEFR